MKTHENYEQLLKLFTYTYTHTDIYIYIHTYTNFIDISWFYDVHRCSHCLPRARWEPRSVADSDFFRSRYGAPGADGLTQRMIIQIQWDRAWQLNNLRTRWPSQDPCRDAQKLKDHHVSWCPHGQMQWQHRMELYNNYLVDLLRPIDWQGEALSSS